MAHEPLPKAAAPRSPPPASPTTCHVHQSQGQALPQSAALSGPFTGTLLPLSNSFCQPAPSSAARSPQLAFQTQPQPHLLRESPPGARDPCRASTFMPGLRLLLWSFALVRLRLSRARVGTFLGVMLLCQQHAWCHVHRYLVRVEMTHITPTAFDSGTARLLVAECGKQRLPALVGRWRGEQ